ncbi:MAG: flagellar biosynthesis anti-sigma factor FlgM [Alcaligenaceae bacterium]|nr:flagellar biosynthesis anti-sigma factor FlgM [Alcaligenaceae bacterium]
MKINSTSTNHPVNGVAGGVRPDAAGGTQGAGQASAGKPAVDLSPAARHLAGLQDGSQDIQAERVQEIRDAIASGELRMDPERIAGGLLVSVRDLLK